MGSKKYWMIDHYDGMEWWGLGEYPGDTEDEALAEYRRQSGADSPEEEYRVYSL